MRQPARLSHRLNEKIQVAVRLGVAASMTAEQDDSSGMKSFHDGPRLLTALANWRPHDTCRSSAAFTTAVHLANR
jgi:hypothetical protein